MKTITIEDISSEMFEFNSALNAVSTFASSFRQEMEKDQISPEELADRKGLAKFDKLKGTEEERSLSSITAGQQLWISDTLFREYIEGENYSHLQCLVFLDTVNTAVKKEDGTYKRVHTLSQEARELRNQLQRFKTPLLRKYAKAYQAQLEA